ncbi:P-loop containing nucleoside triphosphate hydrolase protein [Biscogniauxia marginata]|nr:P-loop containing nucleoside triphosphate hydrolase protein [Biscogniauxia marginata]
MPEAANQLPIIYLQGSTASGKGTLGSKLAAEFNMYHLSLGDATRKLTAACRQPIPGMPKAVNACVAQGQPIPEEVLAKFDVIPAVLQVHNARASKKNILPALIRPILLEKIAEITSACAAQRRENEGKRKYTAIVLDGYPLWPDHVREAQELFGSALSGLVIFIECPEDVARARYLARGGGRHNTGDSFESRMRNFKVASKKVLRMMEENGTILVRTVNDDSMSVEEAYQMLRGRLAETPIWRELIGNKAT